MADEVGTIYVKIAADVDQLTAGVRQINARLDDIAKATAAPISGFSRLQAQIVTFNQAAQLIGQIVRPIQNVVGEFARLADTASMLSARIRLTTSSQAEFASVQEQLYGVAQRTRTSLETTTELYARLALNSADLGASQGELMQVIETLNKSLATSGRTGSEASAGLLQLSQAFAKGKFDGDEFRSVLENLPPVAQALQKSLGVTRGELFALAQEGQLTGRVVFDAILQMKNGVDQAFSTLPMTVGAAWQSVANDTLRAVAEFDKATGASKILAEGVLGISDAIKVVVPVAIDLYNHLGNVVGVMRDIAASPVAGAFLELGRSLANLVISQDAARYSTGELNLELLKLARESDVTRSALVAIAGSAGDAVATAMERFATNARDASAAIATVAREVQGAAAAFDAFNNKTLTGAQTLEGLKTSGLSATSQLEILQAQLRAALGAENVDVQNVTRLKDAILAIGIAANDSASKAAGITRTLHDLQGKLKAAADEAAYTGKSFNLTAAQTKAYEEALRSLRVGGFGQSHPEVVKLRNELDRLTGAKSAAKAATKEAEKAERDHARALKEAAEEQQRVADAVLDYSNQLQEAAEGPIDAFTKSVEAIQWEAQTAGMTTTQRELANLQREYDAAKRSIDLLYAGTDQYDAKLAELNANLAGAQQGIRVIGEEASRVGSSIGEAFEEAIAGIAAGTRDLEDIPGLFKDVFASAFADSITEKLKFDELFKGNIFDLVGQIGDFLGSGNGLVGAFSSAFDSILGGAGSFVSGLGSILSNIGLDSIGSAVSGLGSLLGGGASGGASSALGSLLGGLGGGAGGLGGLTSLLGGGGSTAGGGWSAAFAAQQAGSAASSGVAGFSITTGQLYALLPAVAAIVGAELQKSGSQTIYGIGSGLSAAAQPVPSDIFKQVGSKPFSLDTIPMALEGLSKSLMRGGPVIEAIIAGFENQLSGGQMSRRFLGNEVLGNMPNIAGLGETLNFDPYVTGITSIERAMERYPELFAQAGGAATAFGAALAASVDSGQNDAKEINYIVSTLIDNFGAAGLTGSQALTQIATSAQNLGLSVAQVADVGFAHLQTQFAAGELSLAQYVAGLQSIEGLAGTVAANTGAVFDAFLSGGTIEGIRSSFAELESLGIDTFGQLGDFMAETFGKQGKELLEAFGDLGIETFESLADLSTDELTKIQSAMQNTLGAEATKIFDTFKAAGVDTMSAIEAASRNKFSEIGAFLGGTFYDQAKGVFEALKSSGIGSFEGLQSASVDQLRKLSSAIDGLGPNAHSVFEALKSVGISNFQGLVDGSKKQLNRLIEALEDIPNITRTITLVEQKKSSPAVHADLVERYTELARTLTEIPNVMRNLTVRESIPMLAGGAVVAHSPGVDAMGRSFGAARPDTRSVADRQAEYERRARDAMDRNNSLLETVVLAQRETTDSLRSPGAAGRTYSQVDRVMRKTRASSLGGRTP